MATCRICLHEFKTLRFESPRISICGRCVNTLNESPEVAETAEQRIGEMLRRGIERRALQDLEVGEPWQQEKARQTLSNIDTVHAAALPKWLNRLLADSKNTRRDFKLLRAHRRGLLHYDRPIGWGYPSNWKDVASRIRQLDDYRCTGCAASDFIIDVHHIVYVSNFGTHQQTNLISLCRPCHESEHKRSFDFGEGDKEQVLQIPVISPTVAPLVQDAAVPALTSEGAETTSSFLPNPVVQQKQVSQATSTSPSEQHLIQAPQPLKSTPLRVDAPATTTDQKFCGSCRTLVLPQRRFLIFKYCPNCRMRM